MHPSIFKSYDIRGVIPEDWEALDARRIAKALCKLKNPKRVLIGHDARPTSAAVQEALIGGFVTSGVSVMKVGACSTPMFTFAMGEADGAYDLGVMVTASHNPAKYNGLKILTSDVLPLGIGSGMEELRDLAMSDEPLLDAQTIGTVEETGDLVDRYVSYVFSLAKFSPLKQPVRIAIDAGNGMNGLTLPKLCKAIPELEASKLYWDPDCTFPNHEANPLKRETLDELRKLVVRDDCLMGVAFDGDGDRVGFVDEKGDPVPGDLMVAILTTALLRKQKQDGKPIVLHDVRTSWSVAEAIKEAGGEPQDVRVGHAHIKRAMRETGAAFAGELSMHYYFPQMWSGESGELAMLLLLDLLIATGKPLSELWRPLAVYANTGELNYPVEDARSVLARLRETYAPHASNVSELDGIKCEFRSTEQPWWFSARASNTEPLLRLVVEAKTEELLQEKLGELETIIKG